MIPTTINGLAVVVIALLPGFVWVSVRDRLGPARSLSAFRETAVVLAVSATAYASVFAALGLAAVMRADIRARVATFLADPTKFRTEHALEFWGSVAAATAVSVIGTAITGAAVRRRRRHDSMASAWWNVFSSNGKNDAATRRVSVYLNDGSLIVGNLNSFSREVLEHGDRDLVLQAPMWIQPTGADALEELSGVATIISARNITYLNVEMFTVATDAPFRPARARETWRLAAVESVAFAPRGWPEPLRRCIGVASYLSKLLWLAGWMGAGDVYSTDRHEAVVISRRSAPGSVAQFVTVGVAAALAILSTLVQLPLSVTIAAAAVAVLVGAPPIVTSVDALRNRRLLRALRDVRAAVNARGGGHTILSAARPSTCPTGTIGRIAAYIGTRPDLQPCFAVAANDRLAQMYRREMLPIGATGLAFMSSAETGQRQDSETDQADSERG